MHKTAANPTQTRKGRNRLRDGAIPKLRGISRILQGSQWELHKKKHRTSRFLICEILGIDGATNYETGPEMSRPFEVSNFKKSAPSIRALSKWAVPSTFIAVYLFLFSCFYFCFLFSSHFLLPGMTVPHDFHFFG